MAEIPMTPKLIHHTSVHRRLGITGFLDFVNRPEIQCYTPLLQPFRIYTPKSLLFLFPSLAARSHGSVHQRERKKEQHVMSTLLVADLDDSGHDLYHVYGGDNCILVLLGHQVFPCDSSNTQILYDRKQIQLLLFTKYKQVLFPI
jgi:hypothetical protein